MLGINDSKFYWDADDFVGAYADLVEALFDEIAGLRAVFVATPYLAVGTCCEMDQDLVNGPIPDAVVDFVDSYGDDRVHLVDLREPWLAATGCADSDDCETFYDDDGLHPSERGSE